MNSTDGGMVRSNYIFVLRTLGKMIDTELVFGIPKITKSTMQDSSSNIKATIIN